MHLLPHFLFDAANPDPEHFSTAQILLPGFSQYRFRYSSLDTDFAVLFHPVPGD
jgi:hypothetical protein